MRQSYLFLVSLFIPWGSASAQPAVPHFVGEVIIVGNEVISDSMIRCEVELYPGQKLMAADIERTQRHLIDSGKFVNDAANGISPSVTVLPNDGPFKDILIRVKEKPLEERVLMKVMPIALAVIAGILILLLMWWFLSYLSRRTKRRTALYE